MHASKQFTCKWVGVVKVKKHAMMTSITIFFYFFQLTPPPAFIDERIVLFDKLKAEHDTLLAGKGSFS